MDVADKGFDYETGHGLINCYRAVKEVLRRKAKREGKSAGKYTGRKKGDVLDVRALAKELGDLAYVVLRVGPKGQAAALGVQVGDIVLKYGGTEIRSRADLQGAKKAVTEAGVEETAVLLQRDGKTLEMKFKPGQLGITGAGRYEAPVFR